MPVVMPPHGSRAGPPCTGQAVSEWPQGAELPTGACAGMPQKSPALRDDSHARTP